MSSRSASEEIGKGERFAFGSNWAGFLKVLNEERIVEAEDSLKKMLGTDSLVGRSFLDVGSGSGLFSLAARRLGASVRSFDFDESSVACANELKRRYFEGDPDWEISGGNVLDTSWLTALGEWDVVYSWGVLHHTGDMWRALENVVLLVAPGGSLFLSIYNDQGRRSRIWRWIKRRYCSGGKLVKFLLICLCFPVLWGPSLILGLIRHGNPFHYWNGYKRKRGMSPMHDLIDWVGGYPFEVAKPEEIFDFYHARGFALQKLCTCGGRLGCNQFVFERPLDARGAS